MSEKFDGAVQQGEAPEAAEEKAEQLKDSAAANALKDKAASVLDAAKAKVGELRDSIASGELKDKADDFLADAREKAAPVIDKVVGAAGDVVGKVKDAATAVMSGEKPVMEVKNELFAELGEQVAGDKAAIEKQAEEMQKKIEEMLGGKGEE